MLPLMHLFKATDRISGRTKIQKMVYILQCMGFPFTEVYRYHLHGPYSETLTRELNHLVDLGFLTERVEDLGDVKRFHYSATPELNSFLLEFSNDVVVTARGIPLDTVARELNACQSQVLEAAATALFLNRMGVKRVVLERELRSRKPHLTRVLDLSIQHLDTWAERGWLELV